MINKFKVGDRVVVYPNRDEGWARRNYGVRKAEGTIVAKNSQFCISFDNSDLNIPYQDYNDIKRRTGESIPFEGYCYFINDNFTLLRIIKNTKLARFIYPEKTVTRCGEYLI